MEARMSVEATLATWRLPKSKVTSSEKLLLLACANRAGESHECWPSIKRLCADTGMDRKTIITVRQSVIDKKLLNYTGSFKGRSGQIPVMQLTYVDDSVSEFTSTENGTSPKNGTRTSPKNGTGDQSQKRDTESKRENLKEEPKHTPKSPKGESVRFEEFWNLYPVKIGRKACEQKWNKRNLDVIADKIIANLTVQVEEDDKWLRGFAPNPLTYINQDRWEDEIAKPPKTSSKSDSFNKYMNSQSKGETYDQHGNTYDPFR